MSKATCSEVSDSRDISEARRQFKRPQKLQKRRQEDFEKHERRREMTRNFRNTSLEFHNHPSTLLVEVLLRSALPERLS